MAVVVFHGENKYSSGIEARAPTVKVEPKFLVIIMIIILMFLEKGS